MFSIALGIILLWKSLSTFAVLPNLNLNGKIVPKIKWEDKSGRTVIVLFLWGVFNLSFWAIFPEVWWKWHDMEQFFWGTQGTIIAVLILEVVFKSKENAPVITRMRQALMFIVFLGFVNVGYEPVHEFLKELWKTPECTEGIDCKDDLAALDKKNKSFENVVDTITAPVGKLSRGFVINHETTTVPSAEVEVVIFRKGKLLKKFIDTPGVKTRISVRRGDTLYFISHTGNPVEIKIVKL